jgi:hypothetical protein
MALCIWTLAERARLPLFRALEESGLGFRGRWPRKESNCGGVVQLDTKAEFDSLISSSAKVNDTAQEIPQMCLWSVFPSP